MRILITGASGLLGLNLALQAAPHHQVFGVVHSTRVVTDAFQGITANLLDQDVLETLVEHTQPDWVIHCAALTDLETCEKNPTLAQRINTEIPGKLAGIVARGGARFLHVSTDAVFDGTLAGGTLDSYREDDAPNPLGVYAQTKLAAEQAVAAANPEALICRVTMFGYSPSGTHSLAEFFLYNLLAGRQIKGFTDVFFCPLLVNELADIFLTMLERRLTGLYHVFSSECLSKYDFGVRIAHAFGLDPELINPISVKASHLTAARSPNLVMNTDKLSTALGISLPKISPMIQKFYTLYQQGYPQALKAMVQSTGHE